MGPVRIGADSACVVTVHDLIDESLPSEMLPDHASFGTVSELGPTLARADHAIAVSESTRSALLQRYGLAPDRVTTVRHGVDAVFRRAARMDLAEAQNLIAGVEAEGPFLLHVGGREGYKNFRALLLAYGVTPLRDRFRLIAVGSQTHFLPAEQPLVDALGLAGRVTLTGRVEDQALAALYRTASVVVLPSLCEGFGLPLVEAMASGALVASSITPAFREMGGEVPVYFDAADPMDIARAIETASGEEGGSRREAGIERASRFRWDDAVRQTIAVYRQVTRA
jgi:glycosyltransferase involved in cell wall biosynthesis